MLRRVVLPVVLVALAAAACGGGEEPAAVEDTAPAVEVPPFEVVKDEGRETELLSEGVEYLWVNGTAVIEQGQAAADALPGRVLRHRPPAGTCDPAPRPAD